MFTEIFMYGILNLLARKHEGEIYEGFKRQNGFDSLHLN